MTAQLVVLGVLLACSAFFSGAETALFSLTRHEMSNFARDPRASHRLVAQLVSHPRHLLLTLMVGNVTVNMFIFAASLRIFQQLADGRAALAAALGLISPIVVTLFGELLPKGVSIIARTRIAPAIAPLIRGVSLVMQPITTVLNAALVEPFTRVLAGTREPDEYVTVDELRELVEMSQRGRIINAGENAMLSGIVSLNRLRARDVMVHRVDLVAFDIHDDPDELRRLMREEHFTKIPVYNTNIDDITGLIYAKELFLNPDKPLAALIRPVRYLPEMITLTQVLKHFRETHTQLAIVVDEHGGVVGLVTVEDVAEQIVGDLAEPEQEEEAALWERIDERRYRVAGSLSIQDWSDQFNIRRFDSRVSTIAGLLAARLGRIPEVGDKIRMGNLRMSVESLRGNRVEWILLELLNGRGTSKAIGGDV